MLPFFMSEIQVLSATLTSTPPFYNLKRWLFDCYIIVMEFIGTFVVIMQSYYFCKRYIVTGLLVFV